MDDQAGAAPRAEPEGAKQERVRELMQQVAKLQEENEALKQENVEVSNKPELSTTNSSHAQLTQSIPSLLSTACHVTLFPLERFYYAVPFNINSQSKKSSGDYLG